MSSVASPLVEFVLFPGQPVPEGWPALPGSVVRDTAGQAVLLHVGPLRWFAPAAVPGLSAAFQGLERAGTGAALRVDGKYEVCDFSGAVGARILASTLDLAGILRSRDCAAVTLFDCPALLLRESGGYRVWVQTSYAAHFKAAVERAAAICAKIRG